MEYIGTLMEQHKQLVDMSIDMLSQLDTPNFKERSVPLTEALLALSELIDTHLQMEDRYLYPMLFEHSNILVRESARMLMEEMEDLKGRFDAYSGRWLLDGAISNSPEQFKKETREVSRALLKRIYKEDHELYPLVLQMESVSMKR
ncbi:MAG: hemerythrin domain-containing protein [Thermoplasmata archaeon]|nr:hemerythrin domain-containing protein [Thermoplasmata archaeon]